MRDSDRYGSGSYESGSDESDGYESDSYESGTYGSDPTVYWRRRGVAIAGVVAVVLFLLWAFSGPSRPESDNQAVPEFAAAGARPLGFQQPAPAAGEPVAPPPGYPSPPPTARPALPAAGAQRAGLPAGSRQVASPSSAQPGLVQSGAVQPGAAQPGAAQPGAAQPGAAQPGAAQPGSPSVLPDAPGPPAANSDSAPDQGRQPIRTRPRPAAVGPCSNRVISVLARVGAKSYRSGTKPDFQLVVTNVGDMPCTRDLDAGLQEMIVSGPGNTRLWSSNDCYPAKGADVRTLQPGKPLVFALAWAGRTSNPGCGGQRGAVGPGNYRLVAKLGALSSGPTPFTIVE